MAVTGQARRRGTARLLTLCAVLFGLFLMHGSPAGAADGCHGAMSASAGVHGGHTAAAMPPAAPVDSVHPGGQQAADSSGQHGQMCVSTPARDRAPLQAGGLLAVAAVLAVVFLAVRPLAPGRSGRRGPPPPGGRSLLLQVCIARR
jgi:hypothetical protein